MNKIAIIAIYYGKFPNYFDLWLKSCVDNKKIDFLIFTDQTIEVESDNIKIIKMSLEEMCFLFSKKLNLDISIKRPYKLCDFKPTYGYVFDDYLKKYDYWGHCDIDLVFGDLYYFFEKYKLYDYDKFLEFGHLSMYRNTVENNSRFMECEKWDSILMSDINNAFDEFAIVNLYKDKKYSFFRLPLMADIDPRFGRFKLVNKQDDHKFQIFVKENKKIFQYYLLPFKISTKEYMYIHFQKRNIKIDVIDEPYKLGRKGFSNYNKINLFEIIKSNCYYGIIIELIICIYLKLKREQKKLVVNSEKK